MSQKYTGVSWWSQKWYSVFVYKLAPHGSYKKIILNTVACIHARWLNIKNMVVYSVGRCGFIGRDKCIWMFHTLLSAPEVLQKLTFIWPCLKVKKLKRRKSNNLNILIPEISKTQNKSVFIVNPPQLLRLCCTENVKTISDKNTFIEGGFLQQTDEREWSWTCTVYELQWRFSSP